MQMQFLALGAKCGGRGASGLAGSGGVVSAAASRPSSRNSEATASRPTPEALVARKSRRDWRIEACRGCMGQILAIPGARLKVLSLPRAVDHQHACHVVVLAAADHHRDVVIHRA